MDFLRSKKIWFMFNVKLLGCTLKGYPVIPQIALAIRNIGMRVRNFFGFVLRRLSGRVPSEGSVGGGQKGKCHQLQYLL